MENIHASACFYSNQGILILGKPGSGKSSLLLYLLTQAPMASSAFLISDDQVLISNHMDQLIANPPDSIAGQMEVFGVGLFEDIPYKTDIKIELALQLSPTDQITRLPETDTQSVSLLGFEIPCYTVAQRDMAQAANCLEAILHPQWKLKKC